MRILTGIWLTLMVAMAFAGESSKPFLLGVHPYLPRADLMAHFAPLADYLSHEIGRPVEIRIGRDYEDHIDAVGNDSVDMAYIGPAEYVKMVSKYGPKPLLARQEINNQPFLKGEIIVRKDSPLGNLSQLQGKSFAFPDAHSTMYIMPVATLLKAGVPLASLGSYKFLEGHYNVAMGVLAGDYDAGAVKDEVYEKFSPRGLKVLAHVMPVYDHIFVASSKLPEPLVEKLRKAMLSLNDTQQGHAIMKSIHSQMTALVLPKDSQYDNIREIMGIKAR